MKEKVFNLILFVEDEIIVGLGACCHHAEGADREKIAFLRRQVGHALAHAERFPVPNRYQLMSPDGWPGTGVQHQSYQKLAVLQRHLDLLEEIFTHISAWAKICFQDRRG